MTNPSPHLTPFVFEALAADTQGLPPEAHSHLSLCEACRGELADIRALHEQFSRTVLPRTLPTIEGRLNRSWTRWWPALVLVPAMAVALLVVLPVRRISGDAVDHDIGSLGIKGEPQLWVYAQRDDRVLAVADGSALNAGDRIRFEIESGGLEYLLVCSVDAAGHVSVYVPYGGAQSVPVDPLKRFTSPGSIELDPVPGPERVFALLSHAPLKASDLEPALQALAAGGPQAIRNTHTLPLVRPGVVGILTTLWENKTR